MNLSYHKYKKPRRQYRIKNITRFIAVLLVAILAIVAVFIVKAKINSKENDIDTAVRPTATATKNPNSEPTNEPTPLPTPEPTPTPYPIPEGKTMNPLLVVIDAGHGGIDGGAPSPFKDGFTEKEIVLDMAKKTEALLIEKGIKVVLTRDDDYRLVDHSDKDLVARWTMANDLDASIFVSIHVNSYDAQSVSGMELYYFDDKPEIFPGFTHKRFMEIMQESITKANGMKFRFSVGDMRLAVVRNTKMPAILVETAYITSKEDHAKLESQEFRQNTAQGIVDGIMVALGEIGAFEHEGEMYVFKEIIEE